MDTTSMETHAKIVQIIAKNVIKQAKNAPYAMMGFIYLGSLVNHAIKAAKLAMITQTNATLAKQATILIKIISANHAPKIALTAI